MRRPLLLGALACLGCDGSGQVREPPPEGAPWLATTYAVEVELLASTCAPGGLTPEARPAVAEVVQQGLSIVWEQRSDAPDADSLFLEGTLCTDEAGAPIMRFAGGRRDTVDGCQAITDVPPGGLGESPGCDPEGQATFAIDECGVLTGTFDTELRYALDCAHRSSCVLTVRITARPTAFDARAPALPSSCN